MISRASVAIALLSTVQSGGSLDAQLPGFAGLGDRTPPPVVRNLALPPPDLLAAERGLELVEEALALSRDEDHAAAAALYLELPDLVPTLSDWAPIFAAESLAESGDTAGVNASLRSLPDDSEVKAGWSWIPISRALEVLELHERAAEVAWEATDAGMPGPVPSFGWLRAGELSLLAADTAGARTAFYRSMDVGGSDRYAVAAADALGELSDLSAVERYRIGKTRVGEGDMRRALEPLRAWSDVEGLSDAERGQARLDLARAYFSDRRYADVERTATAVLEDSSASPAVHARALYWIGRSQYRRGRTEQGRATLEAVADRFPGARAAGDALWLLADLDHDADRLTSARGYYRRILDVVPTSARADVAGMRLGSMAYLEGDYALAREVFDRRWREAGTRSARQQAAYWSGLVHTSLEQPDTAFERFVEAYREDPFSYYGAHAATRTGAPLLAEGLAPGPANGPAIRDGELANAVLRLRVHMRVPTPGSFAFELARMKEHFEARAGGSYALAEALIEGGLPIQGILLGREIQRRTDGWNLRLLRIVYPFPHRELIVREAERREVNPYLAAGLIRQESMFDEDIKSRAGAIGMMQVMPATGRELAQALNIQPFSTIRLTEAEVNVKLGMTFLSEMLRRYDDAVLDALVAYNAGPTRIRRWRTYPEYGNLDVFMERIPFRETRDYVKIVQRNALIYESLYGCGNGDPCLGAVPSPLGGRRASPSDARALSR